MPVAPFFHRVIRQSGSLRVAIPKVFAMALKIQARDYVKIEIHGNSIVISKAEPSFTERGLK